jgi:hypothetical protein
MGGARGGKRGNYLYTAVPVLILHYETRGPLPIAHITWTALLSVSVVPNATTIITTTTTITSSQTSRSALACVGLFDAVDVDVDVKMRGGDDGPLPVLPPPLCPAQPVL